MDRELHTHLSCAISAVRAALGVCGSVARQRTPEASDHRAKLKQLARAERVLDSIGHLDGSSFGEADRKQEARALCSWLESRERTAGVSRPARRGQDYQDRLRTVLGFLEDGNSSVEEDEPAEVKAPEPKPEDETSDGVLWQHAVLLAKQQGEGENYAYIMTIFKRLADGVATDG
jgi:hypothetical protein